MHSDFVKTASFSEGLGFKLVTNFQRWKKELEKNREKILGGGEKKEKEKDKEKEKKEKEKDKDKKEVSSYLK